LASTAPWRAWQTPRADKAGDESDEVFRYAVHSCQRNPGGGGGPGCRRLRGRRPPGRGGLLVVECPVRRAAAAPGAAADWTLPGGNLANTRDVASPITSSNVSTLGVAWVHPVPYKVAPPARAAWSDLFRRVNALPGAPGVLAPVTVVSALLPRRCGGGYAAPHQGRRLGGARHRREPRYRPGVRPGTGRPRSQEDLRGRTHSGRPGRSCVRSASRPWITRRPCGPPPSCSRSARASTIGLNHASRRRHLFASRRPGISILFSELPGLPSAGRSVTLRFGCLPGSRAGRDVVVVVRWCLLSFYPGQRWRSPG
jgi:hypothetical protein